jgi:hypothetical protein
MAAIDPESFDTQIETLTAALERTSDADAQRCARELVSLVLQFHRAGIRRMIDIMAANRGADWQRRFAADPMVAAVLALHEISVAEAGSEASPVAPRLIAITRPSPHRDAASFPGHVHDRSHCDQCGELLGEAHHHTIDIVARTLSCSCRACWLLAGARSGTSSRQPVPDRYLAEPHFALTATQWDALQLPVDVAFFLRNSAVGRTIAFYPSPAGATESSLPLEAWADVERANPWVRTARPDVEAVLVRKRASAEAGPEAFIVPIDACYDLVGRIRTHWRGFDGGERARAEIERFFSEIRMRTARSSNAASEHAR